MNNEALEDQVLNRTKGKSKKVFYIIAGLLVLGVASLFGGIKILSSFSVSADTDLPPIPGDPYTDASVTAVSSITATASTTSQPPTPPDPETTIDVNIPAGWSMISGKTLNGRDTSAFSKAGMFVYSYNDPVIPNRDWIISNPDYTSLLDYFSITTSLRFWAHPSLGYYVYNPGVAQTLELASLTSTRPDSSLIFGRGWHLMYWSGVAQDKDSLLEQIGLTYNDTSSESVYSAVGEDSHKASIKVYVVANQANLSNSSVKELTDSDSTTTISKIPSNSYYWIYLRRTKSRVVNISSSPIASSIPSVTSTTSASDLPPVP